MFIRPPAHEIPDSPQAFEHVRARTTTGLSVGFSPKDRTYDRDGAPVFTAADLVEVSLTPTPAFQGARVREVREIGSPGDLERALRDAGLSRTAAKRITAGGYSALDPSTELAELAREMRGVADLLRR